MAAAIKAGADVRFLRPEITDKLWNIEQIVRYHAPPGYDFVITSGSDGRHSRNSLHYSDMAVDIRTRLSTPGSFFAEEIQLRIKSDLEKYLGPDYDVVIESSHLHLEYDPDLG